MTSNAYKRKKQPELVRRAILDEALRIAAQSGLAEVTIQAVGEAAGVSKGGVFHHFANKRALLEAMSADLLQRLDAEIEDCLRDDAGHGRFTRAYVRTLMTGANFGLGSQFDAIGLAAMMDEQMAQGWQEWFLARLEQHRDTDSDPMLEIVRLAADGAWLANPGGARSQENVAALEARLLAMTWRRSSPPGRGRGGPQDR